MITQLRKMMKSKRKAKSERNVWQGKKIAFNLPSVGLVAVN